VRATEGKSKIISKILVEINETTGVHVQYGETDLGEYYKFFLRNEEDICYFEPPGSHLIKGRALDRKPGARSLKLPSNVWAAEPQTLGSCGKQ
jgi:hypothetical protein